MAWRSVTDVRWGSIGMRFAVFILLLAASALSAAGAGAAPLVIGYLELEGDPRYIEEQAEAQYQAQPWGRPYPGAEVALGESRFAAAAAGAEFELRRVTAKDAEALFAELETLNESGVRFFLVDAPGDVTAELARRSADRPLLLFNVSALDDALRQESCQPHLLHIAPSHRMLQDALAQYLVSVKWRRVLALVGPQDADKAIYEAFQTSAKRYGLRIGETREFVLGTDPRQRSRNNVALLTTGEYDVVYVADARGEFARAVPYQTQKPRVTAGGAGLVPDWWHWAFERYGAPQLNSRFIKHADRRMTGYDWSAWMGIKAIAEAVLRTGGTDFERLRDYLRSDKLVLDGFKGNRLSFRPWDNQLRQPIMLTTPNWVIGLAPIEGFLHQTNNLDTLGQDERESRCDFD